MEEPVNEENLYHKYLRGETNTTDDMRLWLFFLENKAEPSLGPTIEKEFEELPPVGWSQQPYIQDAFLRVEHQLSKQIKGTVRKKYFKKWFYAAAAAMLLGGLFTYIWDTERPIATSPAIAIQTDIQPGANRAVLKSQHGDVITLSQQAQGIVMGENIVYENGDIIAAAATKEYEFSTPLGGTYQITLSDGTKVWLNAGSSLKFPKNFTDQNRSVYLRGEAFFDVSTDKNRPFIIKSKNQEALVYGTSLNVSAYEEELETRTTLLHGVVRVCGYNPGTGSSGEQLCMLLNPGEQSIVSTKSSSKKIVHASDFSAWKDGVMVFKDMPIKDVVMRLERWYDVQFEVDNWPPGLKLEGEVPRNIKLSGILVTLERFTGKKLSIQERRVVEM